VFRHTALFIVGCGGVSLFLLGLVAWCVLGVGIQLFRVSRGI